MSGEAASESGAAEHAKSDSAIRVAVGSRAVEVVEYGAKPPASSSSSSSSSSLASRPPGEGDARLSSSVQLWSVLHWIQARWLLLRQSPTRQQVFALVVALQGFVLLVERVFILARAVAITTDDTEADRAQLRNAVWFFVITIITIGFLVGNTVDAILTCNYWELVVFRVASALLLVRIAIEYNARTNECEGPNGAACLVFLILDASFFVGQVVVGWNMGYDLRWKKYKAIGSDVTTRDLYSIYELYSSVLSLDLQLSFIVLATGVAFIGPSLAPEFAVNLVLFVVDVIWHQLGLRSMREEDTFKLIIFWVLSAFLPTFIVIIGAEAISPSDSEEARALNDLRNTSELGIIVFIAITAVLNRIGSFILSITLYRHFGVDFHAVRSVLQRGLLVFSDRRRGAHLAGDVATTAASPGASPVRQQEMVGGMRSLITIPALPPASHDVVSPFAHSPTTGIGTSVGSGVGVDVGVSNGAGVGGPTEARTPSPTEDGARGAHGSASGVSDAQESGGAPRRGARRGRSVGASTPGAVGSPSAGPTKPEKPAKPTRRYDADGFVLSDEDEPEGAGRVSGRTGPSGRTAMPDGEEADLLRVIRGLRDDEDGVGRGGGGGEEGDEDADTAGLGAARNGLGAGGADAGADGGGGAADVSRPNPLLEATGTRETRGGVGTEAGGAREGEARGGKGRGKGEGSGWIVPPRLQSGGRGRR